MQPSEVHPFDLKRLLIGEVPGAFLFEVVARAVVTYLILLVAARLMGKRVAGQMSVLELTVVVTLGAAIGVPLEAPERGLLPAVLVLAVAVGYQRLVGHLTFGHRRAVAVFEGAPSVLARDGTLVLEAMRQASISRERVFAMLRSQQLLHLGQVKRAYLEAGGQLSVYVADQPRPGLCLLPTDDGERYEQQFAEPGKFACRSCGNVLDEASRPTYTCPYCHERRWTPAVVTVALGDLRS
jgi:uncharacterized membrane protein YcaP (DUF421 family)